MLFVDEMHRLTPVVEEVLYPAMEDYQLDLMIGEGPGARSIKLNLPPFTLVGATTRAGLLTSPLRDRFGIVQRARVLRGGGPGAAHDTLQVLHRVELEPLHDTETVAQRRGEQPRARGGADQRERRQVELDRARLRAPRRS